MRGGTAEPLKMDEGPRPIHIQLRNPDEWSRIRPSRGRRRFIALDGLRGLAALLVIFYHVQWPTHLTNNNFVKNGYLAVDVFFIISGFVIFQTYVDNVVTVNAFKRFMCLRFFRLYPLHFTILIAFLFMEVIKLAAQGVMGSSSEQAPFTSSNSCAAFVANLLLVHGLHTVNQLSWNTPSWSISCEFFAYIAFGLLALTGAIRNPRFPIAAILVAGAIYCVLAVDFGNLDITYDWGGARCFGGFFLGSSIGFISSFTSHKFPTISFKKAEIAVVVAAVTLMTIVTGPSVALVIPLYVAAIALLKTDQGPAARLLQHWAIQYLGRVSYSIYMVHSLVILTATILLKRVFEVPVFNDSHTHQVTMIINPWLGDVVLVGITTTVLLVATVTYKLIENPGRALGRQLTAAGQSPRWSQSQLDFDFERR
jgi:peptidoglycan/LPS O-acetylase OafA/YrhL